MLHFFFLESLSCYVFFFLGKDFRIILCFLFGKDFRATFVLRFFSLESPFVLRFFKKGFSCYFSFLERTFVLLFFFWKGLLVDGSRPSPRQGCLYCDELEGHLIIFLRDEGFFIAMYPRLASFQSLCSSR